MNTLERHRLVKAQVIDVKVAKAAVNASKRQRAEAHGAQSHARCRCGRSASHGL